MIFLGIEMASVPSYVLAGFQRRRRKGSEAALKFAIFGAATAGVMLYGISLLVGALGSAHLPTMAGQLARVLASGAGGDHVVVLVLGGLMFAVGLAFKLSAVPFHFWAPDVFEGASAEIGAFLSVASKAAALGLLARLALMFGYGPLLGPWVSWVDSPEFLVVTASGWTFHPPVDQLAAWSPFGSSSSAWSCCWPPSRVPSATWPPTARRTSSGCWPIRPSPRPAT